MNDVDVAVIGAGQAGLSAGYFLRRAGLSAVLLDHADGPGGAWRHRWPTLTLGKAHHVHDLPGMPLGEPDAARPASEVVAEYFGRYERTFGLDVRRPVDVSSVSAEDDDPHGRLLLATSGGTYRARGVINATGTWERPFWPYYPGRETFPGRQLHTADYRGPDAFAGRRVVVVGGGASAVQALLEIADVAASTVWVTRRPPLWNDVPFDEDWGRAVVARVADRVRRGLPPESVVGATGLALTPEVRDGITRGVLARRPIFERVTPTGVAWADGTTADADVILWATGFRAALDHLAPLRLRGPGGGVPLDGALTTRVAADHRVHLLGYGPSASTIGANRAGRAAVRELARTLAEALARVSARAPAPGATIVTGV